VETERRELESLICTACGICIYGLFLKSCQEVIDLRLLSLDPGLLLVDGLDQEGNEEFTGSAGATLTQIMMPKDPSRYGSPRCPCFGDLSEAIIRRAF